LAAEFNSRSTVDLGLQHREESAHRLLMQVDGPRAAARHHGGVLDPESAEDEPKALRRDVAIPVK
jgi:hypothetical protein